MKISQFAVPLSQGTPGTPIQLFILIPSRFVSIIEVLVGKRQLRAQLISYHTTPRSSLT